MIRSILIIAITLLTFNGCPAQVKAAIGGDDVFFLGDSLTVDGTYPVAVRSAGYDLVSEARGGWGAYTYANNNDSPLVRYQTSIDLAGFWDFKTGGAEANKVLIALWTNDIHPNAFPNLTAQEKGLQCYNALIKLADAFAAQGSQVAIMFPIAANPSAPQSFKDARWHLSVALVLGSPYELLQTGFTSDNYADTYHPNAAGYGQIAASIINWLGV